MLYEDILPFQKLKGPKHVGMLTGWLGPRRVERSKPANQTHWLYQKSHLLLKVFVLCFYARCCRVFSLWVQQIHQERESVLVDITCRKKLKVQNHVGITKSSRLIHCTRTQAAQHIEPKIQSPHPLSKIKPLNPFFQKSSCPTHCISSCSTHCIQNHATQPTAPKIKPPVVWNSREV